MAATSKKPRLLYICHRIPYPPNKGDKIRSFHFLRYLSKRYDVYLAFLIDNKRDLTYVNDLRRYAQEIAWARLNPKYKKAASLPALMTGKPLSVGYFYSRNLQAQIDQWLSKHEFRSVLVYSSSMAQYVLPLTKVRKVMDFCDVDSDKWRQYAQYASYPMSLLYKLESRRLLRYERHVAENFDDCLFISDEECMLFKQLVPESDPKVVANGVDFGHYNGECQQFDKRDPEPISPYIVFTGAMDYRPNVDAVRWFVEDIFPLVRDKLPDLKFYIVGANPPSVVRKLAHKCDRVIVTGYVNDVRPYIKNAELFVAPIRIARGVQTKILESIALGCPTVATEVAASGLTLPHQLISVTSLNALDFATKMLDVYESRSQIRAMIKRDLAKLNDKLSWEHQLEKLDQCL